MKKTLLPLTLLAACLALWGSSDARSSAGTGLSAARNKARIAAAYASLPLIFEGNHGQVDSRAAFVTRGLGLTVFLTQSGGSVLALQGKDPASPSRTLQMKFYGAALQPQVRGTGQLRSRSHYFIGQDPAQWRTNVPHYSGVHFANVYPGIDVLYYGQQQSLEFDVVVAPGARPEIIELVFEGADRVGIDAQGNLAVQIAGEKIVQSRPRVYQDRQGNRQDIDGKYELTADGRVGFSIAPFDASLPLIIDPVLTYSTFLGGASDDRGFDVAVDTAGNAYITGSTRSDNFPIAGAIQPMKNTGGNRVDVFIAKLNAAGNALVYSTFLGGANPTSEVGNAIAVDGSGNAYITGQTDAPDFPVMNAQQTSFGGGSLDAFVVKINASGSALVYSSYLGGSDTDFGTDVAADAGGSLYVTGTTLSTNFPIANALQTTYAGGNTGQSSPPGGDVFVAKLNAAGSALIYSTYLGGSADDFGRGIAVDSVGSPYLTGSTLSPDFPTFNAFQPAKGAKFDGFVTKLDAAGSSLVFSTYLGGNGLDDHGNGIAVAQSGHVYVAGTTSSTNFPTTAGAFQLVRLGNTSPFVTKFSGTGTLAFSTYLGIGFGDDIAVDTTGNSYVVGETDATFPLVDPVQASFGGGNFDIFLAKLDASGSALIYSTFLGGGGTDAVFGRGVAVDSSGSAYVTGVTASLDFPTTAGAFQTLKGDTGTTFDAFVAKITDNRPPLADAGDDQVVGCQAVSATPVALDGSSSTDPDNTALTFTWTGAFPEGGGSASGESPTVTLPLGTSTISLVVSDGQLVSGPDTVNITVAVGVSGLLPPLQALVPYGGAVIVPDKALKQGRTVPMKLQLSCGAAALTDADVSPPRIVQLTREGDAMDLETIDPDSGTANDNGLLFRYSSPNWIYNLNTQGLEPGTYVISIEMPDGLRYSAAFVLK